MLSAHTLVLLANTSKPVIDFDGTIFIQLGLFLLLYFILKPLVFHPYLKMKQQRERQTTGSQHEAEELQKQATLLQQQYEKSLKEATVQAEKDRFLLRKEQQEKNQQILEQVKTQMDQKWELFQKELSLQIAQAQQNLEKQAPLIAKAVASQILGRGVEE